MSAESDALVRAYESASATVRDRVVAHAAAVWSASGGFRDAEVDRIVARIVPAVQAGQLQMAALTDAYIGRMSVLAGVRWTAGVDRSVVSYRGVPDSEVYRRPAVTVYTALADGENYSVAVERGARRLGSIVATDLQQARTRQSSSSIGHSGFAGFRRVLTGNENCALCAIASTQRYHKGDLMPVHPGCDCGVEPISGDAGRQVIDSRTLEQTHADIEARLGGTDRGARDLGIGKTDVKGRPLSDFTDLIVTHEHGEYGPTLSWRSQHFTSEAQITALN